MKIYLKALPLVAGVLALGTAAALAGGKVDVRQKSLDDPRSGAALNRLAAKEALATGAVAAPGPGTPAPRYIFHSPVNDRFADTNAQNTQSETSVVDLGAGHLVAAFNDSGSLLPGGNHFTGYAFSDNNGLSWTDAGRLPNSAEGDVGDPVLAYHQASNAVYLVTLGFTTGENLQVFKSTDFGHSFGAPVNGTPGFATTGDFQDKPWLAVDNFAGAGTGNVYLCWTRFGATEDIKFTRSTDGGATFGPSGGVQLSAGGQGCFVTVSPNHQVNVFYYRGTGGGGQGGDNKLFLRRSTDQGVTFGAEVQVADLKTTTINGSLALNGGVRSNSFPHAAVNPIAARPIQIVVYNDIDPANPSNKADVYYVRSTDNGSTWSAPVRFNNDLWGDQFFPTLAFVNAGEQLMLGYYSRSHDPGNLAFHRRGRRGILFPGGFINLTVNSFQLGPNTPPVLGQDPVINATYMGDYDVIAGGAGQFSSTWADNRLPPATATGFNYQPDVRFARISIPSPSTDLAVSASASSATINLGDTITFTVTASATGGEARDVFVNAALVGNYGFQSASAPGSQCTIANNFLSCSVGTIAAGTSKQAQILATAVGNTGSRTFKANVSTSSIDANPSNDASSPVTVTVNAGSTVSKTYSTGNIAVALPDNSTVQVPLTVPDAGGVVSIRAYVRMNHTFDADVRLSLKSPLGQTVSLVRNRGGSGDNFGALTNDCAGTPTVFYDFAATAIAAGTAPFSGTFKPEAPMLNAVANGPSDGLWTLIAQDTANADTGVIGCFKLSITRVP